MTTSPAHHGIDAAAMIDHLGRQCELYRRLKELSDRQSRHVAAGDAEPLLSVLSQRQEIVEQIDRINQRIAPLRDRWPQLSPTLEAEQRDRINQLLDEVERLLQAILHQDDRDRQQLQSAREQVAGELRQVHQSGQAVSAYRSNPGASAAPRFTDRQG